MARDRTIIGPRTSDPSLEVHPTVPIRIASAVTLAYIIAGPLAHHTTVLRKRYLVAQADKVGRPTETRPIASVWP